MSVRCQKLYLIILKDATVAFAYSFPKPVKKGKINRVMSAELMHQNNQKTVVVGMSGGVDSSLTAALLQEQGYAVIGVYMKNWSEPIKGVEHCPWIQDQLDARMVAQQLNIPFYTVDFEDEYKKYVVTSFLEDYKVGRTPNPDILCNQFIKFDYFYKYAKSLGADFVATGHYARSEDGKLLKGVDPKKDQSYFLWAINKDVLPEVLFPLGGMEKDQVRHEAGQRGLVTAKKKDSQGICFIGQADVRDFLSHYFAPKQGNVLDKEGKIVGQHRGAVFYTIGQRAGISDVAWPDPTDRPTLYVLSVNTQDNTITIGEESDLYDSGLEADGTHWFGDIPAVGAQLTAKIRYGQQATPCVILETGANAVRVSFDTPQRAITPGQSIVLYRDDQVIGGAIINKAL